MDDLVYKAARDLAASTNTVALTGAGISVESGIPPFRGPGGLWEKIDPMEFAHIDAFLKDPAKVWNVLVKEMQGILDHAKPNDAHRGLARLEELGILKTIITQNVDGLHQKAGNTDVIEFHGNFAWLCCLDCHAKYETEKVDLSEIPPRCNCGGIYKPDCVFLAKWSLLSICYGRSRLLRTAISCLCWGHRLQSNPPLSCLLSPNKPVQR